MVDQFVTSSYVLNRHFLLDKSKHGPKEASWKELSLMCDFVLTSSAQGYFFIGQKLRQILLRRCVTVELK